MELCLLQMVSDYDETLHKQWREKELTKRERLVIGLSYTRKHKAREI